MTCLCGNDQDIGVAMESRLATLLIGKSAKITMQTAAQPDCRPWDPARNACE